MRVGIYGRHFGDSFITNIQELFTTMHALGWSYMIYEPFNESLKNRINILSEPVFFNRHEEIWGKIDLLI